ncbi:hypothetical protein Tco_1472840, partial [Tanacetum coccineum]
MIRLCTHEKRQGRERDSRNAAWPGPTNGKEGRWRKDIATYVSNCLTCLKVNAGTSKTFGFIVTTIDTRVEVLSQIVKEDLLQGFWQILQKALGTRLDMSMAYHPQTDGQ